MQKKTITEIQRYIREQQAKGILSDSVKNIIINSQEFKDIKLRKVE